MFTFQGDILHFAVHIISLILVPDGTFIIGLMNKAFRQDFNNGPLTPVKGYKYSSRAEIDIY